MLANRTLYRLSVVLCTISVMGCNRPEIQLAFNTRDTTSQRFALESQLKIIVSSDTIREAMNSQLQAILSSRHLVSYDDGSARYNFKADSVSYSSDQRSVEECRHIERYLSMQDFQFKMGPSGEIGDLRMTEFVPDLERTDIDIRKLLLKIQPVLPGFAVRTGTTWERQQLLEEDKGRQAFVYKWFRVDEVFEQDGKQFARLRMNIKYKLDETADSISQVPLRSEDFILGSGVLLFNVSAGQIESASMEISGQLHVVVAPDGDSIPGMRVRQIIHLRRLPNE